MTQKDIEEQTMWKRPSCNYCKTPESALVLWSGKPTCGLCVAKLHEWQQSESNRIMQEVINNAT